MKLWIGKEREGKLKGLTTLFVGSPEVNYKDLENVANKNFFEQIYFGAGRCSKINYKTVQDAIENFPFCYITLEVDVSVIPEISKDIIQDRKVQIIVSVTDNKFKYLKKISASKVQVKVQALTDNKDMFIRIGQLELFDGVDEDDLKGEKYKDDKVLLE